MNPRSLPSIYALLSGSQTEGQLENPRERQRQLHALYDALQSSTKAILAASPSDTTMLSQIALSLTSIRALLNAISPSHLLATEQAIAHSSASDPARRKPAGLTMVLAEEWAPISTTIMPVAAALAAGCQSLVCVPSSTAGAGSKDQVWRILRESILDKAIDKGSFGMVSYDDVLDLFRDHRNKGQDSPFQFDIIVSQGTSAACGIVDQLVSRELVRFRVLEPCRGGVAAVVVSRSVENSLQAVVADIQSTLSSLSQGEKVNAVRVPRVVFVDEYVVEKFTEEMEKVTSGSRAMDGGEKNSSGRLSVVQLPATSDHSAEELRAMIRGIPDDGGTIVVVSTTSLDDAIDQLNKLNYRTESPVTYLFSTNDEAAYLSQFLNAQQHIIGGIPLITQLINPPADVYASSTRSKETQAFDIDCLGLLYSIDQFSKCRPVFNSANGSLRTPFLGSALQPAKDLPIQITRRLDPIGQSKGGTVSYFTQGLLVSLIFIVLPGVSLVGYQGWQLLPRLFR